MKYLVSLFVLFLASSVCHARLGETEDQIVARYGKPTATGKVVDRLQYDSFRHGGYEIQVAFLDGKSQSETYLPNPDNSGPLHRKIEKFEVQILLDANALGSKWTNTTNYAYTGDDFPNGTIWELESKAAKATYVYESLGSILRIESTIYLDYLKQQSDKAAQNLEKDRKKALQDF